MRTTKFWAGGITIFPMHRVEVTDDSGRSRKALRGAGFGELNECGARLLSHAGASRILQSVTITAYGPSFVVCGVPRLSDDHDADAARVERFINAVFFGEPTEGLDAAPPTETPSP